MEILLSGIAASVAKNRIYNYAGKKTSKDLITEIQALYPALSKIKLEISVNDFTDKTRTASFTENDRVMVFSAYAGG